MIEIARGSSKRRVRLFEPMRLLLKVPRRHQNEVVRIRKNPGCMRPNCMHEISQVPILGCVKPLLQACVRGPATMLSMMTVDANAGKCNSSLKLNPFAAAVCKQVGKACAPHEFGVVEMPLTDKRRCSERVREAAGHTEEPNTAKKPKQGGGKAAKGKEAAKGSDGAQVLTKAQLTAMATGDRGLLVQDVDALEKGGVLCFAWAHWSKAVDPAIVDVPW